MSLKNIEKTFRGFYGVESEIVLQDRTKDFFEKMFRDFEDNRKLIDIFEGIALSLGEFSLLNESNLIDPGFCFTSLIDSSAVVGKYGYSQILKVRISKFADIYTIYVVDVISVIHNGRTVNFRPQLTPRSVQSASHLLGLVSESAYLEGFDYVPPPLLGTTVEDFKIEKASNKFATLYNVLFSLSEYL